MTNNFVPNSTDWFGRWRLTGNKQNDWLIDRDIQKANLSFSGIDGVHMQDQAMTESMGAIIDRSEEHLMESDLMVARSRRRILKAARAFSEDNLPPPGVDSHEAYFTPRGGFCITETSDEWNKVYKAQLEGLFHPGQVDATDKA